MDNPAVTVNQNIVPKEGIAVYQNREGGLQARETLDLMVTEDTLINILVSKGEAAIREKIAALNAHIKTLQSASDAAVAAEQEYRSGWTKRHISSLEAQTPLSNASILSLKASLESFLQYPVDVYFSDGSFNDIRSIIKGTITLSSNNFSVEREIYIDAPAEYLALRKNVKKAASDVDAAKRELLNARSALTNIDALERQAKARIAENVANRTDQGRALVENLSKSLDVDALIESLRV